MQGLFFQKFCLILAVDLLPFFLPVFLVGVRSFLVQDSLSLPSSWCVAAGRGEGRRSEEEAFLSLRDVLMCWSGRSGGSGKVSLFLPEWAHAGGVSGMLLFFWRDVGGDGVKFPFLDEGAEGDHVAYQKRPAATCSHGASGCCVALPV